uniref:Translation initiation factor 3 N-terminal domain-containing protein n=1 Tax=Nelumbo nucifera TaxID=4432 RepID=A0A822ZKR5_NELNU|nr:TPA_asm: hypothetical protein HUJ06_003563 [Nelumbo nucifera]
MAGITSSLPFKTLVSERTTPSILFLSSLESKLCGIRLCNLYLAKIDCSRSSSVAPQVSITARSSGYWSSGETRRPRGNRKAEFEADSALDISSIRSPSVRLIDEQQNMVGVVSKSEALQMAEDAELDLSILTGLFRSWDFVLPFILNPGASQMEVNEHSQSMAL